MATQNITYKRWNGTEWVTLYFATSAGQVGETTSLKFFRPLTNTINGKSFFDGTVPKGVTLYAEDIAMSSNNTATISTVLSSTQGTVSTLNQWFQLSNAAGGPLSLNNNGKVDEKYLPDSILGQLSYCGLVNASANTIVEVTAHSGGDISQSATNRKLPSKSQMMEHLSGTKLDETTYFIPKVGDYFICNSAGTLHNLTLAVGDWAIWNGAGNGWVKVDNTDAVSSVAGLTGNITAESLAAAIGGNLGSGIHYGDTESSVSSPKEGDILLEY